MASRIAKEFLASQGIVLSHNKTERANFATGRGTGKLSSPYHIVAVDSRYGTSKRTVGWARTIEEAREKLSRLETVERSKRDHRTGIGTEVATGRGGAEYHENRTYHYIMDIRTNEQVS